MKAIKSIGIETELFLTKGQWYSQTNPYRIHNATYELYKMLGVWINANEDKGYIQLGKDARLTTDGTPVEFTGYKQANELYWLIENQLYFINAVSKSLLKDFNVCWDAYKESGEQVKFENPGYIYASNKTIQNAYTKMSMVQDKKEEDGKVTKRTAGLHIHLELNDNKLLKLPHFTNNLIKALDEIYYGNYHSAIFQSAGYMQREEMTPRGWYRLKTQENGVNTIEYRQLTTKMLKDRSLYGFLVAADEAINSLIKNIK